ncbi:ArnT family glycosyltransferase [Actinomadura kijaniata]|uniref:ArnT family glycosyltransferase n=1 Tax=Actinomadura kijaniata TaxID=46161 RepID=UPI000A0744BC|nr:glycosyltransferase family 39 protein [Actinomadura kijaniata]
MAGRVVVAFAVVVLLGQMAAGMVTAALRQTPTVDEPVYVAAAVVYQRQHDLRYNPEHPPLGKLVVGAGVAFADPRFDPAFAGSQYRAGRHLLYGAGNDPWRLMLWARLPVIVLTLLFGLVVFAFARDLAGTAGGLAALGLYAFSPDVIAHGSLATLDVPAAGFLLTAVWLVWLARRRPGLCLPLAGVALGAAMATKMNAVAAVPVVCGLVVASVRNARRTRRLAAGLLAAAGVAVTAAVVVWVCYLAVDPRLRWTPPGGVPDVGGLRGLLVDALPLPRPYRDGMRMQFAFDRYGFDYASRVEGFLFGRRYAGSLWYYLPAALLVKTPLGALALWAAGAVVMVARLRAAAVYVLVPAAVLTGVAMTGSRDLGVRYVVFVPMFLAVAGACVFLVRRRWARVAGAAALAFVAVSSLRTFPYYLPYSNEAFGGPARTHRHLHDSNVDWGQDLGRLADHLRERHPGERVWLLYKGSGVPEHYGIRASDPLAVPPERVRGVLAVSNSRIAKADRRLRALLATSRPVGTVGHSITVYRRD